MEYLHGQIHESYQKSLFYQSLEDWSWSVCIEGKRVSDLKESSDWDNYLETLEILEGDIVEVRWFRERPDAFIYVYLDKIIRGGIEIEIKQETIMSKDFIYHNLDNVLREDNTFGSLFHDMTQVYRRDEKINVILHD